MNIYLTVRVFLLIVPYLKAAETAGPSKNDSNSLTFEHGMNLNFNSAVENVDSKSLHQNRSTYKHFCIISFVYLQWNIG